MARSNYIQLPQRAFFRSLTHAQHHILSALCYLDFRYASGTVHDRFFTISDRALANFVGCDTHTITSAKSTLAKENLIATWIGKNSTSCYRILFEKPI